MDIARQFVKQHLLERPIPASYQAELASLRDRIVDAAGGVLPGAQDTEVAELLAVDERHFALSLLGEWSGFFTELGTRADVADGVSREEARAMIDGVGKVVFAQAHGGLVLRLSEWALGPFDLPLPAHGRHLPVSVLQVGSMAEAAGLPRETLLSVVAAETVIGDLLLSEHQVASLVREHVWAYAAGCEVDTELLTTEGWSVEQDTAGRARVSVEDPDAVLRAFRPDAMRSVAARLEGYAGRIGAASTLLVPRFVSWLEPAELAQAMLLMSQRRADPPEVDVYLRSSLGLGVRRAGARGALTALQASGADASVDDLRGFVGAPLSERT